MTEEIPVKRKRGRPRKVVEAAPTPVKTALPKRDPERGKHRINPGDIAGYNTADMNYQFKVVRRVETTDAPTWIWGSTKGDSEVDMVIEETECVLLQARV